MNTTMYPSKKLHVRGENSDEDQISSSDQLTASDNDNPFRNSVVLARFLQLCDKSDLRIFRLVSKEWYNLSLTRFREEMAVNICLQVQDNANDESNFLDDLLPRPTEWLDWETLTDELEIEGGRKPFRSFRLFDVEFGRPPGKPHRFMYNMTMQLFWRKFGHWIHKLKLTDVYIYSVDSFKRAIFEETPNMKVLTVEDTMSQMFGEDDEDGIEVANPQLNLTSYKITSKSARTWNVPITFRLFFSKFPNIKKLGLSQAFDCSPLLVNTLERKDMQKLVITDLGIFLDEDEENTAGRLFHLPQLHLSSLRLRIWKKKLLQHVVTALQLHGAGLEKLSLQCLWDVSSPDERENVDDEDEEMLYFPFRFQSFSSLSKLVLLHNAVRNFHFLECMPNLKVLRMFFCNKDIFENTDMSKMGNLCLEHLRMLDFTEVEIKETAMEMFVKLMPNLESLTANLGTPSIRVVFQNWRNLKELELAPIQGEHQIGNEGITGIEVGRELRHPNITNLKYLQKVVLENFGANGITDVSVWEGFLKLAYLQTLTVCLSHETSAEAFNALVQRFPGGGVTRRPQPSRQSPQHSSSNGSDDDSA